MRQVTFTPTARFALNTLGARRRSVLRVINRLRDFDPDHFDDVRKLERPGPLYALRTVEDIDAFFRLLPSGAVEVVALIREAAARAVRAEVGQG